MKNLALKKWKTISRKTVLAFNRYLVVECHEVALPDGKVIPDWAWIIIPDAVIIVAITPDHQFVCFRQTKYAIKDSTLAPVGGMIERDEEPIAAAKRELQEETGFKSSDWINLGSFIQEPNRGVNTIHCFLARDVIRHGLPNPYNSDLEEQEMTLLSEKAVRQALSNGEFKSISWISAFYLALDFIHRE